MRPSEAILQGWDLHAIVMASLPERRRISFSLAVNDLRRILWRALDLVAMGHLCLFLGGVAAVAVEGAYLGLPSRPKADQPIYSLIDHSVCERLPARPNYLVLYCDLATEPQMLDALVRGRLIPIEEGLLQEGLAAQYTGNLSTDDLTESTTASVVAGRPGTWKPILSHNLEVAGWRAFNSDRRIAAVNIVASDRYFLMLTKTSAESDEELVRIATDLNWDDNNHIRQQLLSRLQE